MSDSVNTNNLPYFTKRYVETDAMFCEAIDFANHCIMHTPGAEKHMLQLIKLRQASRQGHLAVHNDFGAISSLEAQLSNILSLTDDIAIETTSSGTHNQPSTIDMTTDNSLTISSIATTTFHTQPNTTNTNHKFTKIRIKNDNYASFSTQMLTQMNYITPNKRKKTPSVKEGKKRRKTNKKIKEEYDNGMKQTILPFIDLTNVDNNDCKMPAGNKKK